MNGLTKIDFPDIEGIEVPPFVRNIADGKTPPNRRSECFQFPLDQPKMSQIQHELEALTKSDSSLIQKYVGLYHQIRMLKEEVECYNHEASKLIRTEEERKKYAVRRTDIPAQALARLPSAADSSVFGEKKAEKQRTSKSGKSGGRAKSSSLSVRNDSVNSIVSSNSSNDSEALKRQMEEEEKEFGEISMPEEGELSNLDVQWFLNYNKSLSRKAKQ